MPILTDKPGNLLEVSGEDGRLQEQAKEKMRTKYKQYFKED